MADIDERWVIDVDMKNVANDLNKFTAKINTPARVGGRNPSQAGGFVKPKSIGSKINTVLGAAALMVPYARGAKIKIPKEVKVPKTVNVPKPIEVPKPIQVARTLADKEEQKIRVQIHSRDPNLTKSPLRDRKTPEYATPEQLSQDIADEMGKYVRPDVTANPMLDQQVFDKAKTIQLRIK